MRILVVGSGGREHALCWAIAASPLTSALFCAPGNAGIADEATCVPIAMDDLDALVRFTRDEEIDFVVVGPEAPLVAGLVDKLTAAGIKAFGPTAAAAILEGSKAFTKDFCARHAIPTAAYGRFTDTEAAKAYIREQGVPIVVKADGLAAGKGVIIAETVEQALEAVDSIMADRAFGDAGLEIVVEAFLVGEEASFFALVDGTNAIPLVAAQDHKRVGDGDVGPNTGGMGAYSPAPVVDAAMSERIMAEIIEPTVRGMAAEDRTFKGVLFAGLMITEEGPSLIEYNVRFGDPECQVLVMRLMSDLLPALIASAEGQLAHFDLRWFDEPALTVVMAAKGYPGAYEKNTVIRNVEKVGGPDGAAAEIGGDIQVFHAGTTRDGDGRLLAIGGRVLGVTAIAGSISDARDAAYKAVDAIDWPDGFCRRDIAWRALERG
ncbi:MAG: phosphoribosylamine--glycine ligase [Alphaproteobacteria bacterium]|nr:phosphoribosylamine--glycine ligase [Alphaproteobacteria bacterium]